MLFDIMPDPAKPRPLPQCLKADAERELQRLKARLSPEDLALLEAREEFHSLLGVSDFIAQVIFSCPQEFMKLAKAGALDTPANADGSGAGAKIADEVNAFLPETLPEPDLKKRLRVFRRTRLAVLAWRDLTGRAPLEESFKTLTATAEALVLRTLELSRRALKIAFGDALDDDGQPLPLLTYGMGKLGGGELNFSSDLDLIFCCPHDGETSGGRSSISFREFFQRIVQRTANLLSDLTSDSFCYRIDLRLRPFGDAGPLVSTFDAMSNYYETQGRTWERYALVKARLLGGPEVSEGRYGDELISMLRPFVFRRYLDYGAVESLRKLKRLIESEVRRRGLINNFKLGEGGIREVEFIAQTFELMRGGRIPQLRERSLRKVLAALPGLGLMPAEVSRMLDDCYCMLRRTENCLQELSDRQTQTLPDSPRDRARLLWALNRDADDPKAWDEFCADLKKVTTAVHGEFVKVVASDAGEDEEAPEVKADPLADLLSGPAALEDLLPLVTDEFKKARPDLENEPDLKALCDEISKLTRSLSRMPVGPVGREALLRLLPLAVRALCRLADPERLDKIFSRLAALIQTVALRTPYLQLMRDNRKVLERVIAIISENPYATDLITAHPILLDDLLTPQYLQKPPRPEEFLAMIQERMLRVDPDDLEQQMEELRLFKKLMVFRVSLSDKAGTLPLMKVSDCLTFLAEALVRELLLLSWRYTVKNLGMPEGTSAADPGLAVIGYGKLGGIELGYKSDLDMVFIRAVNDGETIGERQVPCLTFYQRLVQKFIHFSATRTSGGVLYDLDMRLRPDGDSGMLISDIAGFEEYQLKRAWTWEHQALVRARPIAGSPEIMKRFAQIREKVLRTPRDRQKLREDVLSMRDKMRAHLDRGKNGLFDLKQSPGGMIDIEFIAQYLLLREAPAHPDMMLWSDNVRILDECARLGILSAEDAEALKNAYIAIRSWYHRLSLADLKRILPVSEMPKECEDVKRIWDQIFAV